MTVQLRAFILIGIFRSLFLISVSVDIHSLIELNPYLTNVENRVSS